MGFRTVRLLALLLLPALWGSAIGEEDIKVKLLPGKSLAGAPFNVTVSFTNATSGKPIPASKFELVHERVLHLVALGADLDTFMHVHPEDSGPIPKGAKAFTFQKLMLPKGGAYTFAFAGAVAEGDVSVHTKFSVSGLPLQSPTIPEDRVGLMSLTTASIINKAPVPAVSLTYLLSAAAQKPTPATSSLLTGSSYYVTLTGPTGKACIPGQTAYYTWKVMSAKDKKPVTNLTIYLGAAMHLAAVSKDRKFFYHGHGMAGPVEMPMDTSPPPMGKAKPPSPPGKGKSPPPMEDHSMHGGMDMGKSPPPKEDHSMHGGMDMGESPPPMAMDMEDHSMHGRKLFQGGHMDHMDMDMASTFGPEVHVEVTLPKKGKYVLIGQLSRGSELILAPFYISCDGKPVATKQPPSPPHHM